MAARFLKLAQIQNIWNKAPPATKKAKRKACPVPSIRYCCSPSYASTVSSLSSDSGPSTGQQIGDPSLVGTSWVTVEGWTLASSGAALVQQDPDTLRNKPSSQLDQYQAEKPRKPIADHARWNGYYGRVMAMRRCPPNTYKWTSNDWAAFRGKCILTEPYEPEPRKVRCGFGNLVIRLLLTAYQWIAPQEDSGGSTSELRIPTAASRAPIEKLLPCSASSPLSLLRRALQYRYRINYPAFIVTVASLTIHEVVNTVDLAKQVRRQCSSTRPVFIVMCMENTVRT